MPIPEPKEEEKEKEFLNRCFNSKVMKKEFPDKGQRWAVCNSKWESKEKKKNKE